MLILIDKSILDTKFETDAEACEGINNVLSSAYRGEHFVLGSRDVLERLARNINLSSTARSVIRKIISQYSTIAPLASTLTAKITVSYGKVSCCTKTSERTWEIPAQTLSFCGITKAVLVCENLNDAKLFLHAARQYKLLKQISGEISLEKAGGGGSTTPDCFENLVNAEKRWGICIADSDRLFPNQAPDTTAAKCNSIAVNTTVVAKFIDVPFREVENIVPLAFLAEVIPPSHRYLWERHLNFIYSIRFDAHGFGDLKRGIILDKIFSYQTGSPERTFWNNVTADFIKVGELQGDCFEQGFCSKKRKSEPCECLLISGYGDKLLELVIALLENKSIHESVRIVQNDMNSDSWLKIGREVFEWGCAPQRMRA